MANGRNGKAGGMGRRSDPKAQRLGRRDPELDLFLRNLDEIEIRLDDDELEVTATYPDTSNRYGSGNLSLTRTFDLEEHEELRRLVQRLVAAVQEAVAAGDPDYEPARCDRCVKADCCSFDRIHLSEDERRRILEFLGERDDEKANRRYFRPDDDLGGYYRTVFRHRDGHCVFLKEIDGQWRCSIYPVRPQVCRDFDAAYCSEYSELRPKRRARRS